MQYGAVELANSYTQTFTFGYYDLQEAADAAAANNYISDETRRQTQFASKASSNAAFGALSVGALNKGLEVVGKSRTAAQVANTRLGQFGGRVASNPLAKRTAIVASQAENAIDAAKDTTRAAVAFSNGDIAGGIASVAELADNLSFRPRVPKAHAKPVKVELPIVNRRFTPKPSTHGKVGEVLSGIEKNTGKILINGRNRIPDGISREALSEVKNVKKLSYTQQLRDYADIAAKRKIRFDLYVRAETAKNGLSGPLLQAIDDNIINLKIIPGL